MTCMRKRDPERLSLLPAHAIPKGNELGKPRPAALSVVRRGLREVCAGSLIMEPNFSFFLFTHLPRGPVIPDVSRRVGQNFDGRFGIRLSISVCRQIDALTDRAERVCMSRPLCPSVKVKLVSTTCPHRHLP